MRDRIESALSFIPADERETWVMCAMGVKSELGDDGFDIWDDWSQQSKSYNAAAARSVWKSCKGSGVSIGSVFHEAKANGWVDNDKNSKPSKDQLQARQRAMQERLTKEGLDRSLEQQAAAKKAAWIMHQTKPEKHAYLDSKGFKEAIGAVWWPSENNNFLCIPMRVGDNLVGIQMIDRTGAKKFLKGQRTSCAEYVISNNGRGCVDFYTEGYATGLSLRECLHALRMRYRVHITFSAGNLVKVAEKYGSGIVIADMDASGTGERSAIQTGLPYWISDTVGDDFNDYHRKMGLFRASQMLKKFIHDAQPAD
jgi:putative DNA primase/helicase